MSRKSQHGFKRLRNAIRYSCQGLKAAFQTEPAFKEELLLAAIMIPLACFLDVTQVERILLIASVLLVLVVELLNSAVEAAIDRISSEQHELSGRAKDLGSAAVMVTMFVTGYVWLEILFLG